MGGGGGGGDKAQGDTYRSVQSYNLEYICEAMYLQFIARSWGGYGLKFLHWINWHIIIIRGSGTVIRGARIMPALK